MSAPSFLSKVITCGILFVLNWYLADMLVTALSIFSTNTLYSVAIWDTTYVVAMAAFCLQSLTVVGLVPHCERVHRLQVKLFNALFILIVLHPLQGVSLAAFLGFLQSLGSLVVCVGALSVLVAATERGEEQVRLLMRFLC